jgi:outer membrane protein TolC
VSALALVVLLAGDGSLMLDEVLDGAQASFPSLVAARAEVEVAEADALAAAGGFDPTLRARAWAIPVGGYPQTRLESVIDAPTPLWGTSLFAGYRLGTGKIADYYGERYTWSAGELRAGAVVPLLRNGPTDRRRTSLARAELGKRIAGLTVEHQRLEVTRLATFRYWEWVAAGQRRRVAQDLVKLALVRDRQLEGRARLGEVPVVERQENQRAVLQREAFLVQAQRAVEAAAFELSLYVRGGDGEPTLPDDHRLPLEVPEPSGAGFELEATDELLLRRPDVQRLTGQVEQAGLEVKLAQVQLLPALDLGLSVSQDLGKSPGPGYDALGKTELELSAVLEVPLLFREGRGRLSAAQAARAKLDAQLKLARERASAEVHDARSALNAAKARIGLQRKEISVAEQLEGAERTKFELGDSSLLLVNVREQATAEARLRQLDALIEAHKAEASLLAALALTRSNVRVGSAPP